MDDSTESNSGWQQSDETPAGGGSANYHDAYSNFNGDLSTYSDGDQLTATNAGGTDVSHSNSGDVGAFNSSNQSREVDTSTNHYGTPTITTTTDSSSDSGTSNSGSTNGGLETLGAGESDQGNVSTFTSSSNEQDGSTNQITATTATNGQVGANEFLNSTETYTELDLSPSSTDIQSDSGSDTWLPTGDTEVDDSSNIVTSGDQSTVTDTLISTDTTTPSSGSTSTTSVHNSSSHGITGGQLDSNTDHHTETSGADGTNHVANDDNIYSDHSQSSDTYTVDNNSSLIASTPVTGGSILVTGSSHIVDGGTATEAVGASAETNTADPKTNHETDTSSTTNNDQGTQTTQNAVNMHATDPSTGVVTAILTGDSNLDLFTDSDSQNLSVTNIAGVMTAESGQIGVSSADSDVGGSTSLVTVTGNPASGVAIDYLDQSMTTRQGGSSDTQQDTLTAIGTDSGSDVFSNHDDESTIENGHSNTSQESSTDDGQCNTSSIQESDLLTFGQTGSQHASDSGSETFADVNGVATSDDESDTAIQSSVLNPSHTETTSTNDGSVTSDPSTGLTTTATKIAGSSDTTGEQDVKSSTDTHSASLSNPGSDVTSGTNSTNGTEVSSDSLNNRVNQAGLLPTGQAVNITNDYVQADNSQDTYSTTGQLHSDGTSTATNSVSGTFNTPTLYDAQYGTTSTTDPSSGITTTNTFANVIDTTGTDGASNGGTAVTSADGSTTDTPANSDTGSLQQAWSLVNITSQSDAAGNPIGTVTTTSDIGGDTQSKLNGALTDAGLTDVQAAITTAAGTTPPASQPVANPGELLASQQPNTGNEAPQTDPQQPANPQVAAVQQAAENLQNGVQAANEGAANAPGAVPAGNAQGAPAAQNSMAAALPGRMNGNIGNQAIPPPNVAMPGSSTGSASDAAAAAAKEARIQALVSEYGPLVVVSTIAGSTTGRWGEPRSVTIYRATRSGIELFVDGDTGALLHVIYPSPAPGTPSIGALRPGEGGLPASPPPQADSVLAAQAKISQIRPGIMLGMNTCERYALQLEQNLMLAKIAGKLPGVKSIELVTFYCHANYVTSYSPQVYWRLTTRHAAVKVTFVDGTVRYYDNGWWGNKDAGFPLSAAPDYGTLE